MQDNQDVTGQDRAGQQGQDAPDTFVLVQNMADLLGISIEGVRKRLQRGQLRGVKVRGQWQVALGVPDAEQNNGTNETGKDAPPQDNQRDSMTAVPGAETQLALIRDTLLRPLIEQNERQQQTITEQARMIGRLEERLARMEAEHVREGERWRQTFSNMETQVSTWRADAIRGDQVIDRLTAERGALEARLQTLEAEQEKLPTEGENPALEPVQRSWWDVLTSREMATAIISGLLVGMVISGPPAYLIAVIAEASGLIDVDPLEVATYALAIVTALSAFAFGTFRGYQEHRVHQASAHASQGMTATARATVRQSSENERMDEPAPASGQATQEEVAAAVEAERQTHPEWQVSYSEFLSRLVQAPGLYRRSLVTAVLWYGISLVTVPERGYVAAEHFVVAITGVLMLFGILATSFTIFRRFNLSQHWRDMVMNVLSLVFVSWAFAIPVLDIPPITASMVNTVSGVLGVVMAFVAWWFPRSPRNSG